MVLRRNGMESGMSLEWNQAGIVISIPMFSFTEESNPVMEFLFLFMRLVSWNDARNGIKFT